jgi:dihydrofolate reductase
MSDLNYKKILLVGGATINGLFLKDKLVDEFYLTIEPRLFGTGKNIIEKQILNTKMTLMNVKKINNAGTLLLKYKIT